MENVQGKHFSITDPKGVNTVIYQVYKTKKEFLKDALKYEFDEFEKRPRTFGEDEDVELVNILNIQ